MNKESYHEPHSQLDIQFAFHDHELPFVYKNLTKEAKFVWTDYSIEFLEHENKLCEVHTFNWSVSPVDLILSRRQYDGM